MYVLGVAVKFGRFSKKENNRIQKNVEDFLSLTGLESAEKLLFTYRFPEEKQSITKLKVTYRFCEKLGEYYIIALKRWILLSNGGIIARHIKPFAV